tara:strand:+ start:111 stop:752 length:642 start_codon:yes stop_codon:yes gene_type:complete
MKAQLVGSLLIFLSNSVLSQGTLQTDIADGLDLSTRLDDVRQSGGDQRELTVLAPTLAVEEIDRAVLNKLMQEIANDPVTTKNRLGVSEEIVEDIFVTISNAKGFINDNEHANVQAMCNAWDSSTKKGDDRVSEALDAYKNRDQFTKTFVAKYYRLVLFDIESLLPISAKVKFDVYMDDRRRRMATSGTRSWGSVVENVKSGREVVNFHCRRN